MLSPKKLLENARNRIAKRENWTTNALALDEHMDRDTVQRLLDYGRLNEHMVMPTDPTAKCWCALGALSAEAGEVAESPHDQFGLHRYQSLEDPEYSFTDKRRWERLPENFQEAVMALQKAIFTSGKVNFGWDEKLKKSVWAYNDDTTHEDVLAMFDTAIANLKGE